MAHKIITLAIVQTIICQMAFSAVINRIGGCGCGGGCGCSNVLQELPPLISYPPSFLPPNQVIYDQPTTIIQDSTVANNLANALQLLVVSNLLSNTLPFEQNLPVLPANLELLSGCAGAPVSLAPSIGAPLSLAPSIVNQFSSCGCGGCGCNSCGISGLGPYNFVY